MAGNVRLEYGNGQDVRTPRVPDDEQGQPEAGGGAHESPAAREAASDLRKATGYSRRTLAAKVKMKQPSLSKLKNPRDMQVTTLQKLVALGGEAALL